MHGRPFGLRSILQIVVSAAAYYLVARLALLMAIPPGYATAVWPAAGLGLVGTLVWGKRIVPGIWLGSFLVNVGTSFDGSTAETIARSLAVGGVIAIGAALQVLIGRNLIRRYVGFASPLEDERDILRFVMLGGPIACLTSATVGVTTLTATGVVDGSSYAFNWFTWWAGDTIGVLVFAPLALLVLRRDGRSGRRRSLVVGLPLAVGFCAVTLIFLRASTWEHERLRSEFERRSISVGTVLHSQLSKYEETVTGLASLFEASTDVTRREFATFSKRALANNPGVLALSWNPVVRESERAAYEARARADGLASFQFTELGSDGTVRPAAHRPEYVPVYFVEPQRTNAGVLGFDTASEPARRDAIARARRSGQLAVSGHVELVQAAGVGHSNLGVVLLAPTFHRSGSAETRGYAVAVFRMADLVEAALREVDHAGMSLSVIDEPAGGRVVLYPGVPADRVDGTLGITTVPIAFGDRLWHLKVAPTTDYVAGLRSWQAWMVLAGGLFFIGLLGVVLLMTTGRASQLEHLSAEAAASELRYRTLYEELPDMCLSVDMPAATVVDCNQTLCERLGYAKAELLGKPFHIVYHPDYLAVFAERQALFQASGEFVDVERTLRKKDGGTIEVSLNLRAIRNRDGEIVGGRAVWRDIGQRRKIERDRQLLVQLGEILGSSSDIPELLLAVSTALGRYLLVPRCAFVEVDRDNDRVTIHRDYHDGVPSATGSVPLSRFSPVTRAEAAQGKTVVITDTASDPRTAASFETGYKLLDVRSTVSVPLLRDGDWVVVLSISSDQVRVWEEREIVLVKLVAERVWSWIEHLRVLAQLRQGAVEAAVSRSEARFRALVQGVKDYAIFTLDAAGNVTSWNAGATKLTGYSDDEIIGKNQELFHLPEDRAAGSPQAVLATAREQGGFSQECWRGRKDGSRFWADVTVTPVFDRDGNLEGYAKVVRDVTERRNQDEALRRSLREREVLLQEVHHRVKNNLQVISSLVSMQVRRLEPGAVREAIEETRTRILTIALIHEKLYQSKDYSEVRLADYAKSLAQNVFHSTNMASRDVRLELQVEDIALGMDRAIPVGLVLNELITNALKHAFKDGRGVLRVELKRVESRLRLTVSDDGVGLPPELDLSRSPSMGLQLVTTLAKQLEAEVVVSRDHGTSFQLTFSGEVS